MGSNAFDEIIARKVRPIEGDTLKVNLGLSEENQVALIESAHVNYKNSI